MSNVVQFKPKEKADEVSRPSSQFDEYTEFKFLADYSARELYINVVFDDHDVNVDVLVNTEIIKRALNNYAGYKVDREFLKAITGAEDYLVEAIYRAYIEFGFIDIAGNLYPLEDIAEKYVEKRLEIGYPKDRRLFNKVQKLEREVFEEAGLDENLISEDLYFKANKY